MRAAIAIDDWKLPIFEKHLSEAGFTYTQSKGLTKKTLMLYVESADLAAMAELEKVVRTANAAADKSKRGRYAH